MFLHAPQQVFQVFQAAQGFQASGQALLFLAGSGGGCDGPRRAPPGARVRRRRRRAGRAGGGAGKRSWQHHSRPASRAATPPSPSRAQAQRFSGTCPAAPGAAEDGVGRSSPARHWDSCGWPDHQSQVAARDERHVGAEAVGGTGLVQQALASSACGAGSWRSCGCSAIGVELPPAGASGRSASRRLPSPGPGSCRRPCSNRDGWHRAPAPRACPGAPDAGWHRRSAAGRPRWSFTP